MHKQTTRDFLKSAPLESKKPSRVLEHLEGHGDAQSRESSSPCDFTMHGASGQGNGRVWPLLGIGADNAVSRAALASVLQVTDRDVRRLVSLERGAGLPICSDVESAGYFRPATLADVERFARSMERRAHHVAQVAEAARRYLDTATGQGRIEEVLNYE